MHDVELRLRNLEDRAALQDVLLDFWAAGDGLSDLEGAVGHFTDDAVIDMSALGLPCVTGRPAIHECFAEAFRDDSQLAHFGTNFRLLGLEGDEAECSMNVIAMSTARAGTRAVNHVQYSLRYRRVGGRWLIARLAERLLAGSGSEQVGGQRQ